MDKLIRDFDNDMMGVYRAAKSDCRYNAVRFLEMLHELGGLQTAQRLLSTEGAQYGFQKLWECGRLDLTVECLVLRQQYRSIFEKSELDKARKRLRAYGYDSVNCER